MEQSSPIHELRIDNPLSPESLQALKHKLFAGRLCCHPVPVTGPLWLYGAGELGLMAWDYFKSLGIPVTGVIDRNAQQVSHPAWKHVRIISPAAVSRSNKSAALLGVCISTLPLGPICAELRDADWARIVPFYDITAAYRHRHPLSNGWFGAPMTPHLQEQMNGVYTSWADDISRAHYLQFLAWRHLRQEWSFSYAPIRTEDRYWPSEIRKAFRREEIFVDVGAFDGRVSQAFLRLPEVPGGRAIAIEGDPINLKILRQRVAAEPSLGDRIQVLDAVISSHTTQVKFCSGLGYASQIHPLGKVVVPTVTLDTLELQPSILKLHVEGAEMDVLDGATETIKVERPIIIATIYHDEKGSVELPLWFINSLSSYSLFFRLCGWAGTSAVIYAVPEERL